MVRSSTGLSLAFALLLSIATAQTLRSRTISLVPCGSLGAPADTWNKGCIDSNCDDCCYPSSTVQVFSDPGATTTENCTIIWKQSDASHYLFLNISTKWIVHFNFLLEPSLNAPVVPSPSPIATDILFYGRAPDTVAIKPTWVQQGSGELNLASNVVISSLKLSLEQKNTKISISNLNFTEISSTPSPPSSQTPTFLPPQGSSPIPALITVKTPQDGFTSAFSEVSLKNIFVASHTTSYPPSSAPQSSIAPSPLPCVINHPSGSAIFKNSLIPNIPVLAQGLSTLFIDSSSKITPSYALLNASSPTSVDVSGNSTITSGSQVASFVTPPVKGNGLSISVYDSTVIGFSNGFAKPDQLQYYGQNYLTFSNAKVFSSFCDLTGWGFPFFGGTIFSGNDTTLQLVGSDSYGQFVAEPMATFEKGANIIVQDICRFSDDSAIQVQNITFKPSSAIYINNLITKSSSGGVESKSFFKTDFNDPLFPYDTPAFISPVGIMSPYKWIFDSTDFEDVSINAGSKGIHLRILRRHHALADSLALVLLLALKEMSIRKLIRSHLLLRALQ